MSTNCGVSKFDTKSKYLFQLPSLSVHPVLFVHSSINVSESYISILSSPQSRSQAVVCVSRGRMYPRSGEVLPSFIPRFVICVQKIDNLWTDGLVSQTPLAFSIVKCWCFYKKCNVLEIWATDLFLKTLHFHFVIDIKHKCQYVLSCWAKLIYFFSCTCMENSACGYALLITTQAN